ncbi:MAG: NAD-dependent epimerase/dehydratase family protein, partial [Desulfuromonadaceae bacterium]
MSRQSVEKQFSTGQIVAVTGGTGFIGRALIHRLLQAGFQVKALRRSTSRSLPVQSQGLTWIEGDLQTVSSLQQLVADAATIIHCAGSVRGKDDADFAVANIQGVAALVQAARASQTRPRFLLLSSLAAKVPEISCYAASKRGGEEILRVEAGDLNWTIMRPPAVYGPGDRELLPLLQWMRRG